MEAKILEPLGMTQTALAEHLGVPIGRINEICRGRRAVTAETAWMRVLAFGTSPQFRLNA